MSAWTPDAKNAAHANAALAMLLSLAPTTAEKSLTKIFLFFKKSKQKARDFREIFERLKNQP
jgi:hypothetical protein